jgi:hypothetical protein
VIATVDMASMYKCSACRKWIKGMDFAEHTFGHEVRGTRSPDGPYSITEASHIVTMTVLHGKTIVAWRARNDMLKPLPRLAARNRRRLAGEKLQPESHQTLALDF